MHVATAWLRELPGVSVADVELSITGTTLRERGPLLITHNGVSGPGQASPLKRLPIGAAPDYPDDAIARREQGPVSVVLDVDASGKPTACTVVRTSSYPTLDSATCKFALGHFDYRPATDFFGRPIADEDFWTATWTLPQ